MYYVPTFRPGAGSGPVVTADRLAAVDAAVTLRDRRLACENSVFRVYLDHLERADGFQVTDYISVIPKVRGPGAIGGVAVLPESEGKVGLLHVYRHPLGSTAWEVPRGFIDPQESAADAAIRELREEMGLATTPGNLVSLGLIAPEPGVIAARVELFAALRCMAVEAAGVRELGHKETRYFTHPEIAELIARGEVQDPFTLIACLMLNKFNGNDAIG